MDGRIDEKPSSRRTAGRYGTWKRWVQNLIQYLILFAIGLTLLFRFVIGVARVSGNSMDPTLHNGQTVWFNRLDH